MNEFLRLQVHRVYKKIKCLFLQECDENELKLSAIFFSPHQDDETLGCGGTIIRKKRMGAEVKIVFMTDGCNSHPHLITKDVLKSIRATEALAATKILGVEKKDVLFLEFESRKLTQYQNAAIQRVTEILLRYNPKEVFIPYYKEARPDHWVTNKIVIAAIRNLKKRVTIYEYPIWFWNHWPWVNVSVNFRLHNLKLLENTFFSNLHFFTHFRCYVNIKEVLVLKRIALNKHESQMTRLIPDKRWATLNDVSNGEFLKCFFQEHEIFYRYVL